MINFVNRLSRRITALVSRGIVKQTKSNSRLEAMVEVGQGDLRDSVELFQPYGLASIPKQGAEAVVLSLGGEASHTIIICADDRRYRLKGLESGEVALYDDKEQSVVLGADGITVNGKTVTVEGDTVTVKGDTVTVEGNSVAVNGQTVSLGGGLQGGVVCAGHVCPVNPSGHIAGSPRVTGAVL